MAAPFAAQFQTLSPSRQMRAMSVNGSRRTPLPRTISTPS